MVATGLLSCLKSIKHLIPEHSPRPGRLLAGQEDQALLSVSVWLDQQHSPRLVPSCLCFSPSMVRTKPGDNVTWQNLETQITPKIGGQGGQALLITPLASLTPAPLSLGKLFANLSCCRNICFPNGKPRVPRHSCLYDTDRQKPLDFPYTGCKYFARKGNKATMGRKGKNLLQGTYRQPEGCRCPWTPSQTHPVPSISKL